MLKVVHLVTAERSAPTAEKPAVHLVVMGVAGSGKSAIAQRVALMLGVEFIEGDDFHPEANRAKMAQGQPLNDADRMGWLTDLAQELIMRPEGAVLACSALKRAYRDRLRSGPAGLRFVHLDIPQAESQRRVAARQDHFYPPSLVASQFEALEDPSQEPGVWVVDGTRPLDKLAVEIALRLGVP